MKIIPRLQLDVFMEKPQLRLIATGEETMKEYDVSWCESITAETPESAAVKASQLAAPAPTVSGEPNLPDVHHQFAVTSTDYSRPFLLGCYATLGAALKAQGGNAEKWDIFVRYAHPAPTRAEVLGEALRRLLACPAIADVDHCDPSWVDPETAEAEAFARRALAGEKP